MTPFPFSIVLVLSWSGTTYLPLMICLSEFPHKYPDSAKCWDFVLQSLRAKTSVPQLMVAFPSAFVDNLVLDANEFASSLCLAPFCHSIHYLSNFFLPLPSWWLLFDIQVAILLSDCWHLGKLNCSQKSCLISDSLLVYVLFHFNQTVSDSPDLCFQFWLVISNHPHQQTVMEHLPCAKGLDYWDYQGEQTPSLVFEELMACPGQIGFVVLLPHTRWLKFTSHRCGSLGLIGLVANRDAC